MDAYVVQLGQIENGVNEGAVVNITYASNGQVSMELGGVDTCDREPMEAECTALCGEMSGFCGSFQEIEKRLKEKGGVLANRISMLPPVEEYAQIINISDYEMSEQAGSYEAASKKQNENKKQAIKKRVIVWKSLKYVRYAECIINLI